MRCESDRSGCHAVLLHSKQVAAEALVVTENELRGKLSAAEEEIAERRQLLADLNTRYDSVAAELAGAEANLSSADALLMNAKAHLALKESLLFEKETLIAALQKRTSAKMAAARAALASSSMALHSAM